MPQRNSKLLKLLQENPNLPVVFLVNGGNKLNATWDFNTSVFENYECYVEEIGKDEKNDFYLEQCDYFKYTDIQKAIIIEIE